MDHFDISFACSIFSKSWEVTNYDFLGVPWPTSHLAHGGCLWVGNFIRSQQIPATPGDAIVLGHLSWFLFRWKYDQCHLQTLAITNNQGGILVPDIFIPPSSRMRFQISPRLRSSIVSRKGAFFVVCCRNIR